MAKIKLEDAFDETIKCYSFLTMINLSCWLRQNNPALFRVYDTFNDMGHWFAIEIMRLSDTGKAEDAQRNLDEALSFPPPMLPKHLRPNTQDANVVMAACQALWPDIASWYSDVAVTESEHKEMSEQLRTAVIKAAPVFDGYAIARCLHDQYGWSVDENLVVELMRMADALSAECAKAVKAWVAHHKLTPELKKGDKVHYRKRGQIHNGVITRVMKQSAMYVCCDTPYKSYTRHIPYEEVKSGHTATG